jgi:emericellamide synthase (highly reducing iterative type I polyketide synthase)
VIVIDPGMCEALSGRMDASLWQEFQKCALSCKALLLITRGATGNTHMSHLPSGLFDRRC